MDNDFALKILPEMDQNTGHPQMKHMPQLCNICKSLKLNTPDFSVKYSLTYLVSNTECELCQLFYNVIVSAGLASRHAVQFLRDGSTLKLMKGGPPVLSLVAHSGLRQRFTWPSTTQLTNHTGYYSHDIQHGFPMIERIPGPVSFGVMRRWLHCCDSSHQCVMPTGSNPMDPSVLLDVGGGLYPSNRIRAVYKNTDSRYVALSYSSAFSFSSASSKNAHGTELELEEMPATCQDAVHVTRTLGIQYLWIDRYCMGKNNEEGATPRSAHEEATAFTNAYVVLVASSAKTADEGLLAPRTARQNVVLTLPEGGVISVCPFIDDFEKDVENSYLSSRASIFQERLLARRSIFFTSSQVYWQCHQDTRAETLTKIAW